MALPSDSGDPLHLDPIVEATDPQDLLLLAISQTCRFQGKSFLKFLLSKETDLDSFRRTRPIKYSVAVGGRASETPPPAAAEPGQAKAKELHEDRRPREPGSAATE